MTKTWIKNTLNKIKEVNSKQKHKSHLTVTKAKEVTDNREVIKVSHLTAVPKINLELKPNYERLQMLLEMRTYSKDPAQDKFISRLQEHFSSLGATTTKDSYGNLYVVKGNADFYPCVVAHTDINQTVRKNVSIMTAYPWIFGFDTDKIEQAGIGADDKVGVYFAIHMFDVFDNIKLFFPKDEEVGLVGTYQANQDFFIDCSMLVQLDRNSYKNDLITYTNGITVCSDEFVTAASSIMDKYMYKKNNGSCTDIGGIKKFNTVNCVAMNVSCGYIDEHSDSEVISIPHFENAINFGYELLKMGVDKVWEHKTVIPVYESNLGKYGTYNNSYSKSTYGGYDTYGTYGTYGSYGGYSGANYDLFDDLESDKLDEKSSKYYTAKSPGGKVKLELKSKEQDAYLLQLYPELTDDEFRKVYLEHHIGYPSDSEIETIAQETVDECISELLCPNCWSSVQPDNSLLLYTTCECCESTFNIPIQDYDA